MALIPKRPAWRDSDPRWRRRMLAGTWVLVLLPLMAAMDHYKWTRDVPLPEFLPEQVDRTLDDSFVRFVYVHLVFCIGVVLMFSKERGRQPVPLDRTRAWGIVGSWLVLTLGAIQMAFLTSLVMSGLAALFNSMWPPAKPAIADWFVTLGAGYLRYGPHPSTTSDTAVASISAIVILLACVPLYNALRSSGPRLLAMIVLAPLPLAAAVQLASIAYYTVAPSTGLTLPGVVFVSVSYGEAYIYDAAYYFRPDLLIGSNSMLASSSSRGMILLEAAKWVACVVIAIWLSIAQLAAIIRGRPKFGDASGAGPPAPLPDSLTQP